MKIKGKYGGHDDDGHNNADEKQGQKPVLKALAFFHVESPPGPILYPYYKCFSIPHGENDGNEPESVDLSILRNPKDYDKLKLQNSRLKN
ncbi:hypothetical protein LBYZC6_11050 [Lacrimispora brassicae]